MKKIFTFLFLIGILSFTQNSYSQISTTNTTNLPQGVDPKLVKQSKSTDTEKFRKIKSEQVPNSNLNTEKFENAIGRGAEAITYSNDGRNLPLNPEGKLVSPDGGIVEFSHPNNPDSTHWCWTPTPTVTDGNRDINCAYSVPCDNPAPPFRITCQTN